MPIPNETISKKKALLYLMPQWNVLEVSRSCMINTVTKACRNPFEYQKAVISKKLKAKAIYIYNLCVVSIALITYTEQTPHTREIATPLPCSTLQILSGKEQEKL